MNHITANSVICHNSVYKDGKALFGNKGADPAGFLLSVYQHFDWQYPKFFKMDNLSKLGWLAAEILLKDVPSARAYLPWEMGVVLSNANSSLDTDRKYLASVKEIPSPSLFVYTLPNIMIGEICIRNNFKGENAFFLSDSFDTDFIVRYVSFLMDTDACQACICGWVELLGEEYGAQLFLIEKRAGEAPAWTASAPPAPLAFTGENIGRIISEGHVKTKIPEK
ncbi:MAG TPA: hypothetical protein VK563_16455 [Puia sp.]|nr:hypothetical protein [Puia sp.]